MLTLGGLVLVSTGLLGAQTVPATTQPTTGSKPKAAPAGPVVIGGYVLTPPKEWRAERPQGTMRKAQLVLPRVTGDSEDASYVVYYFGRGGAGSADANLTRWAGQVERPDGMSAEEHSKRTNKTVHGMKVTIVELRGTFTESSFGHDSTPEPKRSYMMLAAVIEAKEGNYYIKTIGPEKTVENWRKAWHDTIDGLSPQKGAQSRSRSTSRKSS